MELTVGHSLLFSKSAMLAQYYLPIKVMHVGSVALSGLLFTLRGLLRIGAVPLANHPALRFVSYVIDTVLLFSAIVLVLILHQYPFVESWLTTKVVLLVAYIFLGTMALRWARTRSQRIVAVLAALATFAWIVGVAITHDPAGWLLWIPR